MKYSLLILLALIIFTISTVSAQFSRLSTQSNKTLDSFLDTYLEIYPDTARQRDSLVGFSVGLIKNREIVFLKGYGFSNKEDGIRATECTMYRVASVAKTVTAVAALQLIEENELDYEDNIRAYVPEFPFKIENPLPIKVIHLLQHNSCIRKGNMPIQTYIDYVDNNPTFNAIKAVNLFKNEKLIHISNCIIGGSDGNYSNWGYNLLGAVIERASGIPYEQYIKQKIVAPLNMPLFQPELASKDPYPNQSKGYNEDGSRVTKIGGNTGVNLMHLPSGGFIASVTDLTLFAKGLIQSSIFQDEKTRDGMFTLEGLPYSTTTVVGYPYSLGIRVDDSYEYRDPLYFHNGDDLLSSTIICFSNNLSDAVIIMTNRNQWEQDNILPFARRILITYMPDLEVVNPSLYNEIPVENLINLSGNKNGSVVEFARNIMATNYTLTSTANVKLYGEKIILKDGFKATSGSYFLAQFRNANSGCWEE